MRNHLPSFAGAGGVRSSGVRSSGGRSAGGPAPGGRSPGPPDRLPMLQRTIPSGPDVRVVQVKRRPLGPDPRYRGEVVPRRGARSRPFQRVGEAPRVVRGDRLPVLPGLVDVVKEDKGRGTEDERPVVEVLFRRVHVPRRIRKVMKEKNGSSTAPVVNM